MKSPLPKRPKIALPPLDERIYWQKLSIRIGDINYGGHLSNHALLAYAQEIRLNYLKTLQMGEMNFFGQGLIMAHSTVLYLGEGFHGDQLNASLFVGNFWPYGFNFFYLFDRQEEKVASVETGMIYYNYEKREKVKMEKDIAQLLGV